MADEHIPKVLVQALQQAGHAVTTVVELGMRGATDPVLKFYS